MDLNTVQNIKIGQTHIKLTTDLNNIDLSQFIRRKRLELEKYILKNPDFLNSLEPLNEKIKTKSDIILLMNKTSKIADIGPMASVAGTISELSLNYLIKNGSKNSIINNGGDIALINNKKIVCGIYSNNETLNNEIAFKLKARKSPLGICSSSSKIGHSISFGQSDSVTIISKSASISDGLATSIGNEIKGTDDEDAINNGLEKAEKYKEHFIGGLLIKGENVGTIGKLPKIIKTKKFTNDL